MNTQTTIAPGVQIQDDILTDREPRRAEHHAASAAVFAARLLEHYFALGYLSLEYLLYLECHIGINTVLSLIESGLYRKDSAPDYGSRFNDHLIVGGNDHCCCQGSLGATQECDQE